MQILFSWLKGSSVSSPQGCCPRSSLHQQDVRLAAAHEVSECHFILQNTAAAATCRRTLNYHQAHQETERQRGWDLPAVMPCLSWLTVIMKETLPGRHVTGWTLRHERHKGRDLKWSACGCVVMNLSLFTLPLSIDHIRPVTLHFCRC